MKTIVGLFDNFSEAQAVVRELEGAGFDRTNISVVANEKSRGGTSGASTGTASGGDGGGTAAGAASGAMVGGAAGGVAGLLAGLAALAIPGIGPVIAAGPLVAALTGAGIGAVAGGLIGALVSAGVPEEHAKYYEEGVRRGGTLVTVASSDERAEAVMDIMNRHNPVDIEERAATWGTSGAKAATATTVRKAAPTPAPTTQARATNVKGEQHIPVVEEELRVGKREVERGGVRVNAYVQEKPVTEQVTLREEHVKVERRPVDRPATAGDFNQAFKEGTIEVTERSEEAVVQKQARVVEEVVVGKEATERTETVRDTVRRTDVQVEQVGADADRFEKDFRTNFQQTFRGNEYTYEQVKPVYSYGQTLASQHRGADWNTIEPDARRGWEQRSPGTWDKFKDAARFAWDKARDKVS